MEHSKYGNSQQNSTLCQEASGEKAPEDQPKIIQNLSSRHERQSDVRRSLSSNEEQEGESSVASGLLGDSVSSPAEDTPSSQDCSKQRHSQIEKRRRKKMNAYIMELSTLIPKYSSVSKLDKITILRKTVQHVKALQGSTNLFCKLNKPSFLSDDEMQYLIHTVTEKSISESFLFAISCTHGHFLHASESMANILEIDRNDLLGLSIFDLLDHKDVAVLKDQLSYTSHEPVFDPKGSDKVSTADAGISSGSWRSFFCRLKTHYSSQITTDSISGTTNDPHTPSFLTVHCRGFIKPCEVPAASSSHECSDIKQNHLVVVAQYIKPSSMVEMIHLGDPPSFQSRLETDGKIIYVDQRVTGILGYLPQEMLGTSMYEFYHQDDLQVMAKVHQCILQTTKHILSPEYRFRTKSGSYITVQNDMWRFINPWTKITDNIMCLSKVINFKKNTSLASSSECTIDGGGRLAGVGNIGRLIAKNALENEDGSSSGQGSSLPKSKKENNTLSTVNQAGYRTPSIPSTDNSSNSYLQNILYLTPQASPIDGEGLPLAMARPPGPAPYSLINGLRDPNNENISPGVNRCHGRGRSSTETQQVFNPSAVRLQSQTRGQASHLSHWSGRDHDVMNNDNAISLVLSLLEDEPTSGQIDLDDFAWMI